MICRLSLIIFIMLLNACAVKQNKQTLASLDKVKIEIKDNVVKGRL